jgi:hypothetical protein
MDASPLAQLNGRQQQHFVLSPDDISPLSQPSRPNPLRRGPFSRSFPSSFGSFSSSSASKSGSSATSMSSLGSGYFDLNPRPKGDLLSPMACLTADMSANFSLDPRFQSSVISASHTLVPAQDSRPLAAPSSRHCPLVHSLVVDRQPCVPLPLMIIRPPALIQTLPLILRYHTRYQLHKQWPPTQTPLCKTSLTVPIFQFVLLSIGLRLLLSAQYPGNQSTAVSLKQTLSQLLYSKSPACTNFR